MNRYTIHTPVKGYTGAGWGLTFADGIARTDNKALADKLARRGYAVTDAKAPKSDPPKSDPPRE